MRLITFLLVPVFIGGVIPSFSEEPPQELPIEAPELTLYYAPWCYYSNKVLNYLKRIHKAVPLKDIQNTLYKEELIRIGGKRQVPCLIVDGKPIYESNEIIAWLSSHQDLLEDAPAS